MSFTSFEGKNATSIVFGIQDSISESVNFSKDILIFLSSLTSLIEP